MSSSAITLQAAEHRTRIDRIRRDKRIDQRGRLLALWNYLLVNELSEGSTFLVSEPDKRAYIVLGSTNEAIRLPARHGDRWNAYFATKYGIAPMEPEAQFIYEVLRAHILETGTHVELRRFTAVDRATTTVYMSRYDGRLFKIEGEGKITSEPNGTDGIFFADDDVIADRREGVHIEPDIGPHGMLIDRLTTLNFVERGLSGITPEQQRMALTVWIFCLAFPDLMPTKPILLVEGTKGSGKSVTVKSIQLALLGQANPMVMEKNKEGDFGVILLRSPIALFDNADTHIDWVPDAICAYTTSGIWTRRRLYSDDDSMTIRPHAFIAVSSRNPASFRRDDVADRCIILRLDRRPTFGNEKALNAQLLADRPKLFGEYLWYVSKIVDELRATGDLISEETHRMADFAFMARVVGRVLDWDPAAIDDLMLALQGERDAFINEDDPLIDLIEMWLDYRHQSGVKNSGRAMTANQLHAELESLAQARNMMWRASPRTLAQNLRATHLERKFLIDSSTIAGQKVFRVYHQGETRLEIVK